MRRPSRSTIKYGRAAVGITLLGAMLAGCSDIYRDRRETISPLAGNAVDANRVTQMVDPWSKASANNNIAYSGEKMLTASERYRMGRVIPPTQGTTSSASYSQSQQGAQSGGGGQASSSTGGGSQVK